MRPATAPDFELYGLGLEHKHLPEIAGLWRAGAAADLRAVGRQFPAGHAGQRAAASRPAAGQAAARRPRGCAGGTLGVAELVRSCRGRRRQAGGKLEPEALNDTDRSNCGSSATRRYGQAVLVARLDNLGKGASGAAVQNLKLMLGLGADLPRLAGEHQGEEEQ